MRPLNLALTKRSGTTMKLNTFEQQIFYLLHRQTIKNLRGEYYKSGRKKTKHRMRKDLTSRLRRQTGASRQDVHEAINKIRRYLLSLEE